MPPKSTRTASISPRAGGFAKIARRGALLAGHPISFSAALAVVVGWAVLGPVFDFSDTWQLIINTGTTIATFVMVFLIQNTQNRDTQALQIKLDELLRVTEGAHYALMDLEELTDAEIEAVRRRYLELAADGRKRLRGGHSDTGAPRIRL